MQRQIHRMPFHLSYLPNKTFSTVQVNDPEREKNKRQRLLICVSWIGKKIIA